MTRPVRVFLLGCALGVAGLTAAAQYQDDSVRQPPEEDATQRPPEAAPPAGFWPTDMMISRFIDRLVEDDLANTYGLDAEQTENTRALLKERFPRWLKAQRAELMQVTNEYIEALLGGEPPDVEQVAEWAQRVLPLLDSLADEVEGTAEQMRSYMTEGQQVVMDGQLAAFRVGMNAATQRLGTWSEGGFDRETDWFRDPRFEAKQKERERRVHAEMEAAKREAMGLPPEPSGAAATGAPRPSTTRPATATAPAQDDWTRYVEEFVRRYQLNEDQKASAYKFLKAAHEQRERYLRRPAVRARIDEAERKLKEATSDEQRVAANLAGVELSRPLERMFKTLKERLETIPTRAQRQAALERDKSSEAKPAPAKEGAAQGG